MMWASICFIASKVPLHLFSIPISLSPTFSEEYAIDSGSMKTSEDQLKQHSSLFTYFKHNLEGKNVGGMVLSPSCYFILPTKHNFN